jgi:hypothetical protein
MLRYEFSPQRLTLFLVLPQRFKVPRPFLGRMGRQFTAVKRSGKPGAGEDKPTEKQIERDVRGLLSGTKEGRVTIENENPDRTGGHRHVLDEVHPADLHTEVRIDNRTGESPG